MAIPIGALPKLRINLKKKISLYLVFAAGSFAIIAAIIRTVISVQNLRNPLTISSALLWGTVEEAVATLVANAPILRVLVFGGQRFATTSGSRTTGHGTRGRPMRDTYEMTTKQKGVTAIVSSARGQDNPGVPHENSAVVMREIEVKVETEDVKVVDEDTSSSEMSTWAP